ncbi:MAG: response regulator transcription factor [Bacteroidota bacterium]
MEQEQKIKIVIAEDQIILLDGLAEILNKEANLKVVGLAQNGKQALTMIEKEKPDLAILDIRMPVMNGIELTEKLRSTYPEIKILILSLYKEDDSIKKLMSLGIDGYILKERGKIELVTAVNKIMGGEKYLGGAVVQVLMDNMHKPQPKNETHLTNREKEVLVLVAKGYSAAQIAEELFIGVVTVNTHKRNIREKLQIRGAANYLRYAIKNKIIDIDDLDDFPSSN